MKTKQELLESLKALSSNGSGNEKVNAEALLKKLMIKYNISDNDINKNEKHLHIFSYSTTIEKKLIAQVVYSVLGNEKIKAYKSNLNTKSRKLFIECTKSEFIELNAKYNFYKYHLNKDLLLFYQAFVIKNNIYPANEKVDKDYKLTEDDLKAFGIANSLDK